MTAIKVLLVAIGLLVAAMVGGVVMVLVLLYV